MPTLEPLRRSADFERVLRQPPRSRSEHFSVHHLDASPEPRRKRLSTGLDVNRVNPVDDRPAQAWLGSVVPKRHVRRAVTRNAVRRAIRAAATALQPTLPPGLWVVRQRRGFAAGRWRSATSEAFTAALRTELAGLFAPLAAASR